MSRPAAAHGMTSAYLDVTEVEGGRAVVRLTAPAAGLAVPTPEGCREEDASIMCDGGLEGRTIAVAGLGPVVSEVVLSVTFRDGTTASRVLTASDPKWTIPRASRRALLLVDYGRLGLLHILSGIDHLLFLAALALSVRRVRAVLLAETAFTASHSLTFAASALGWIHVSPVAAEACIALSLILMAQDAAGAVKTGMLVSTRRASALAFVFGLVHGLGFAGGLAEIGLPDRAVALALAGFAGGVELGQIAFLALFLGVLALLARAPARLPLVLTYATGGAGAFLFLQRFVSLMRSL
jgi:hypothetical protein